MTPNSSDKALFFLVQSDQSEKIWYEGRDDILKNEYLVDKVVCKVSKYMYVYKLNGKKLIKNVGSNADKKRILSKAVKNVKATFFKMILPEYLFDVSYLDGNIFVILNSQNTDSAKKYSYYLTHFFD